MQTDDGSGPLQGRSRTAQWTAAVFSVVLAAPVLAQTGGSSGPTGEPRRPHESAGQGIVLRLTLKEAIQRGLAANLRVRLQEARSEEAAGTVERRKSALLPRARIEMSSTLQNRNLRAFGLSFPGTPEVVNPFSNYDFRVYADQPLFDRQLIQNWRASERQEEAARHELADARDEVVRLIAALYLNAQAAQARERAAVSRVSVAEELARLAAAQRDAGVATGVDLLRAQVQVANERQRHLETQNAFAQSLLVLARNMGVSPGTAIELAEPLGFEASSAPQVETALAQALAARADYQSLVSQTAALAAQQKANVARYWPRLSVGGNFGGLGRTYSGVRATGLVAGTVSLTVFDRDRSGEEREIESRKKRIEAQMVDLRLGIEQEVRDALLAMDSAAQEVRVAQEGRTLAARELELARDRFQTGVTNNLEVVSAQDSVARALENEILAAVRHTDARMALARALGDTEKNFGK